MYIKQFKCIHYLSLYMRALGILRVFKSNQNTQMSNK
jgi:hypothetical protein